MLSPSNGRTIETGYQSLPLQYLGDLHEESRRMRTEARKRERQEQQSAVRHELTVRFFPGERTARALSGMSRQDQLRTQMLEDSATMMGVVDERYLPRESDPGHLLDAAKTMEERYREHMQAALLSSMDNTPSNRRVRLGGGNGPAFAIVVDRAKMLRITDMKALPWWTSLESGAVKDRLERMHQHRYQCREPNCGRRTTGLVALGHWDCCMPFMASVRGVPSYRFYVKSDCCPPIFRYGWTDRPMEVVTGDLIDALPQGLRPPDYALDEVSIRSEDFLEGKTRVKRVVNVRRYDHETARHVMALASVSRDSADLEAMLARSYYFENVLGSGGSPLLIPLKRVEEHLRLQKLEPESERTFL